jgi:hypothetical protein
MRLLAREDPAPAPIEPPWKKKKPTPSTRGCRNSQTTRGVCRRRVFPAPLARYSATTSSAPDT